MKKKGDLMKQLQPIMHDKEKIEDFIIKNCNLPGPRANLELAFAFAEIYDHYENLEEWLKITEDQADVNDPKSFLTFCSAVCLGKLYTKKKDKKYIISLKKLANDRRWRIREAVVFGFQIIGEYDFEELRSIFSTWIKKTNNLEKRAIAAALAHPPLLDEDRAQFCFEITDVVLTQMDRENDFDVLKKGLQFTISVFAAANPTIGFSFISKWIKKDKMIDRIIKENLKKNRLVKKNPAAVKDLLARL